MVTDPDRLARLEHEVHSTDPTEPGLALRMDRVERQLELIVSGLKATAVAIRWIIGGGGLTTAAAFVYFWRVLQTLSETTP